MQDKDKYSFWTKYKKFATTEILLYAIMVAGIVLSIVLINLFSK